MTLSCYSDSYRGMASAYKFLLDKPSGLIGTAISQLFFSLSAHADTQSLVG